VQYLQIRRGRLRNRLKRERGGGGERNRDIATHVVLVVVLTIERQLIRILLGGGKFFYIYKCLPAIGLFA